MGRRLLALLFLAVAAPAAAQDPASAAASAEPGGAGRVALGLEVDLLPPVLSAIAGTVGFSGQGWVGERHWRLRLVGARFRYPDGLLASDAFNVGFRARDTTALALIGDLFLLPGFRGPWLGGGAELWWNSIGHLSGPGQASWTDVVLTVGGGYVWKVWGNFYLNPWAAVHWTTAGQTIVLFGSTYQPNRLSAEASLKIGWHFWL